MGSPRNRQILRAVAGKSRRRFSRASTGAAGVGHALACIPYDPAGPALFSVSQSLSLFVLRSSSPSVALFACRLPVPLPPLGSPTLFSLCLAVPLTLAFSPGLASSALLGRLPQPPLPPLSFCPPPRIRTPMRRNGGDRRLCLAVAGKGAGPQAASWRELPHASETRWRCERPGRAARKGPSQWPWSPLRGGMAVVDRKGRLGCSTIVTTVTSAGQAGKATGGEQGPTRRQEAGRAGGGSPRRLLRASRGKPPGLAMA
jgi:hypothetical protein